jgi:ATP-dependent exoDNAse (exonuclease V) beta subunit
VDEFQDVDDVQAQIFTKVNAKKHFYIADPDQSIYIFRGADAQVFNKLEGFTTLRLNENYRSCQSIIDFATTVREHTSFSKIYRIEPSWIHCVRMDDPGEVFNLCIQPPYDFVNHRQCSAFNTLKYFIQKKPFILCRANKQVKTIQSLGYRNVSTIHQAKGLEYQNVIVTDFPFDTDEELNVAYVACTRAQDGLLLCDFDELVTALPLLIDEYEQEMGMGNLF